VDLQANALASGALRKTRTLTGESDLFARSLILRRRGRHRRRQSQDKQTERTNRSSCLAHRFRS
jgi:hypothetical protein